MCATFGSGLSSACVVDVGDQKTSLCCVEDGVSHRNSRWGSEQLFMFHLCNHFSIQVIIADIVDLFLHMKLRLSDTL